MRKLPVTNYKDKMMRAFEIRTILNILGASRETMIFARHLNLTMFNVYTS